MAFVVYDLSDAKVYHNGTEVQGTTTHNPVGFNSNPYDRVVVGRVPMDQDRGYSSFEIDEITIWEKALSADEVQAIFDNTSN